MIVYGTRATLCKAEHIFEPCPNCKATNSLQLSIFQRYAHIFWIPFFPVGKTGISVCGNCRQVLKQDQMPPSLKLTYDNIKTQNKIPVWNFTGIGLVVVAIIAGFITQKQKSEKVDKLLLAPKKGDIFQVKVNDTLYTLYKVQKVEPDTVYFILNKYETNEESGLDGLAVKDFDNSITYGFAKSVLNDMNKKDEIIDIDRQ